MKEYEIHTEFDLQTVIDRIKHHRRPTLVGIGGAPPRSNAQNRLQRLWMMQAQEQGDMLAEDYRAYCKLHIGAPILCAESVSFQLRFDREVRPLPYSIQIQMMRIPYDFPVTRFMDKDQKSRYLERIYETLTAQGIRLSIPPDKEVGIRTDNANNPLEDTHGTKGTR